MSLGLKGGASVSPYEPAPGEPKPPEPPYGPPISLRDLLGNVGPGIDEPWASDDMTPTEALLMRLRRWMTKALMP
ncbi:MAG: hypothetical protein K2W96_19210 [Gemmataceae bacterium]|nr:hypothetical protein [Gemmataceae bacterium]